MIESSVVLEELTGDKRKLELRGPGLPFKGAPWRGSQVLSTTWYPGNAVEATQQVLGPKEEPSEWEGEWKRTMLGATPCLYTTGAGTPTKVVSPDLLAQIFDDFRILGSKLRVTWSTSIDGRPVMSRVREGRIGWFEITPDTGYDIRWKVNFAWSGRGGAQQKVVATRDGDLDSAVRAMTVAYNDFAATANLATLVTSRRALLKAPNTLSLGQLEQLAKVPLALVQSALRPIQKATTDLKQLGDIVTSVRAIPFQIANAALAAANNAVAVANTFHDVMSRRPPELNTTRREVSSMTRAAKYFWQAADSSKVVADRAQDLKARVGSPGRKPNDVTARRTIAVHVVKAGETLASISTLYYKNPDHAADIARANRFPWYLRAPVPGRPIIIPILDTNKGG